jgi:hypothetical protein
MAEDLGSRLGGMFRGFKQRAGEAVARSEAAFARGKTAGERVLDDSGDLIVDAGHVIDEAVLHRAARAGKMHAVVRAAGTGQVQDLKEKAGNQMAATAGGQEARALNSVDDYVAARAYIGRITAVEVTDIRGATLVPAGKEIDEDDVRRCREAGQLSALIYSAQQGPPRSAAAPPPPRSTDRGYKPKLHTPAPRATLPLMGPEAKPPDDSR